MPRSSTDIIRQAEALADLVESGDVTLDRSSPEVTAAYKELLAAVIERGKAEEGLTRAPVTTGSLGVSHNHSFEVTAGSQEDRQWSGVDGRQ